MQIPEKELVEWSAIAQIVGVAGQLFAALALALIAYWTYIYTRRNTRMTVSKYIRDLANDWNREIIRTPENIAVANRLRKPIVMQPQDQLIFIYLNYLNSRWWMRQERLSSRQSWSIAKRNSLIWLARLTRQELSDFLDSGYENEFKIEIIDEYDKLTAEMMREAEGSPPALTPSPPSAP